MVRGHKAGIGLVTAAVDVANCKLGLTPSDVTAVAGAAESLLRDSRTELAQMKKSREIHGKRIDKAIEDTQPRFEEVLQGFRELIDNKTAELNEAISAAAKKLEDLRAAYNEHMHLNAAVTYWRDKADAHLKTAKGRRRLLGIYAVVGGAVLIGGLFWLAGHVATLAGDAPSMPISVFIIYTTLGVVASTIGLWIARVPVRLYLSEMHLMTDAEERATMVKTFIALVNEGKAEQDDRTIVLATIFRPTEDGLIKDDSAPDLSPAAIAARILANPNTPGAK